MTSRTALLLPGLLIPLIKNEAKRHLHHSCRKALCGAFLLVLFAGVGRSQDFFKSYSVENGLSQSQVFVIKQDSKGFLWIGTYGGGVNRFDGQTFEKITRKQGLVDNVVYDILEDRSGHIWIATPNGLSCFDGLGFCNFTDSTGLNHNEVWSMLEDRNGVLWFGLHGGGVNLFDGKSFSVLSTENGLVNNFVNSLYEDSDGIIWVATEGGVSRYDGKRFKNFSQKDGLPARGIWAIARDASGRLLVGTMGEGVYGLNGDRFERDPRSDLLPNQAVGDLVLDESGRLWVATDGGIASFDEDGSKIFGKSEGLPDTKIWDLHEDREGNLWIASEAGVSTFRRGFVNFSKSNGLASDVVWSILEDRRGVVWFATDEGALKMVNGQFKSVTKSHGLIDNLVYDIVEDQNGNLWFGTELGVSRYDGSRFINFGSGTVLDDAILGVHADRRGQMWFATEWNGVVRYDGSRFSRLGENEGFKDCSVWAVWEDHKGEMWFGTDKYGIYRFNGETGKYLTSRNGLSDDGISSIIQDSENVYWIGTFTGGVNRLEIDGADLRIDTFSVDHGMSNEEVLSLTFGQGGDLWVGTNRGVNRLDMKAYKATGEKIIRQYGASEGFDGVECNHGAGYLDSKGRLWFGTIGGLNRYDPENDRPNQIEPLTMIRGIRLFLEPLQWEGYADSLDRRTLLPVNLKLSYDKNHVTFDFAGISLTLPDKVLYQFRLYGFENNWSPVSSHKHATYANLSPGHYVFEVKARNGSGVWNEVPTTFAFVITPPFWSTWWFYLMCLVFGTVAVTGFVRFRTRFLQKQRLALEKAVDEKTRALEEEKERLAITLRSIGDGVVATDSSGSVVLLNHVAEDLTGWSQEEARGRPVTEIVITTEALMDFSGGGWVSKILGPGKSTEMAEETVLITRSGEKRSISLSGSRIMDQQGALGVVVVFRDITEKKKSEQEFLKTQKLESLGVLAGGIAHDFNNIISVILGNTSFARLKAGSMSREKLITILTESEKACLRAKDLTQQLVTFSKGGKPVRKVTSMREFIKSSVRFALRGSNVRARFDVAEKLDPAEIDESQMSQVINNIVINAQQAMPEGGELMVTVDNIPAASPKRKKQIPLDEATSYIRISIRDSGVGIPAAHINRIFDPYFTTKQQGSGLGLATSYSIVKSHDGFISVESEIEKGALFEVYLPASPANVIPEKRETAPFKGSGKHILIMDDEDGIRDFLSNILEHLGYLVQTAKNGDELVALFKHHRLAGAEYDAVILDLTIPGGMGGAEALREILKIDPAVKAIVASGYFNHPVMAEYREHGFKGVLTKPFEVHDLIDVLKKVTEPSQN